MIWLLACNPHQPLQETPVPSVPRYGQLVEEWTREERRYSGLETILIARATWQSPELVEAREQQRAFYLLRNVEVVDNETDSYKLDALETWQFLFAGSSDLDPRPEFSEEDSPWRLRLLVNGKECTLKSLEERSPDLMDKALYPWITPWNNIWELRFERDCGRPAEDKPVLQVSGPRAAAELRW
jgi:hypothetical protein